MQRIASRARSRLRRLRPGPLAVLLGLALLPPVASAGEEDPDLRETLEAVLEQNRRLQQRVERLEGQVQSARDEARAARDAATDARGASRGAVSGGPAHRGGGRGGPGLSAGGVEAQLLDLSLDVLTAAGGSTAEDEALVRLQGGGHDPRRNGFNLPQVELSFLGAVDPFFTAEAHLLYFLDPEGESRFEIEEAFVQTQQLPFGLEERGLQLELGQFFTEFGRLNPTHPHAWNWQDQPVVLTRLFGEDGMRNPGARLGWLLPLPWFSELHLGAQSPQGETMVSFLASDEVFEERPVGGRPFREQSVRGPNDLVKLVRWVNGGDLSETWSGQLGLSFLHGPNATGPDAETMIYGADAVLKWRPLVTDRGWPFVVLEGEVMGRRYEADEGCFREGVGTCPGDATNFVEEDALTDWGAYAQLLWGFTRGWATGLRYEYATADGGNVGDVFPEIDADPFRSDRQRVSPLLVYHPSEFSRIRLQYNYDRTDFLDALRREDEDAHTLWAGLEFSFGSHPAHAY